MSDIKELRVGEYDFPKKIIYLAKQMLLSSEQLNLVASTKSAGTASRAAETLVRLGYVNYVNVQTLTDVRNDRRSTKLIITVKKTNSFDKLYKENEEFKKQKDAERQKETETEKAK